MQHEQLVAAPALRYSSTHAQVYSGSSSTDVYLVRVIAYVVVVRASSRRVALVTRTAYSALATLFSEALHQQGVEAFMSDNKQCVSRVYEQVQQ